MLGYLLETISTKNMRRKEEEECCVDLFQKKSLGG
jgi:hypothetical protein